MKYITILNIVSQLMSKNNKPDFVASIASEYAALREKQTQKTVLLSMPDLPIITLLGLSLFPYSQFS